MLALPLSLLVFKALPDRGYLLAKPLSILVTAYIAWIFASLHWMPFSQSSILLAALLLATASLAVVYTRRVDVLAFFRENFRLVIIGEALFLASFAAFLLLRAANPDLWHPFNGGEKPMEMAYLNAVVRSTYMPPYDPWFAGGYINYYYFGQFIVASIVKVTGITTEVAFNLAVPLFFALTTSAVFSLVYNLAEGTRRSLGTAKSGAWAIGAGLAGAFFVAVMGNVDGAIQLGQGLFRALVDGQPFGEFDFWRSSRFHTPGRPAGLRDNRVPILHIPVRRPPRPHDGYTLCSPGPGPGADPGAAHQGRRGHRVKGRPSCAAGAGRWLSAGHQHLGLPHPACRRSGGRADW